MLTADGSLQDARAGHVRLLEEAPILSQKPGLTIRLLFSMVRWMLGPLVAIIFFSSDIFSGVGQDEVFGTLFWVISWWAFEVIPLGATAMLPALLLPIGGVMDSNQAFSHYFHDLNLTVLGGLWMGLAIRHHRLDQRLALNVLCMAKCSVYRVMLVMMTSTWLMSMFMSNTAATACFMPLAVSLHAELCAEFEPDASTEFVAPAASRPMAALGTFLPLALAYSATVGGLATLTGTGPNVAFATMWAEISPERADVVTWTTWLGFGLPVSLLLLLLLMGWAVLGLRRCRPASGWALPASAAERWEARRRSLGSMTWAQGATSVVLALTVVGWVTRGGISRWKGWAPYTERNLCTSGTASGAPSGAAGNAHVHMNGMHPGAVGPHGVSTIACVSSCVSMVCTPPPVGTGTVALGGALLLFVLPARWSARGSARGDVSAGPSAGPSSAGPSARPSGVVLHHLLDSERLLGAAALSEVPWQVVLLLGGGSALSAAIEASKLGDAIAEQLAHALIDVPASLLGLLLALLNASLTQFLSDTATAQITLPIYASVARTAGQDPLRFALPALLACSNAFLLPASTPPNAIAYGTGFFSIRTMASHGLGLSLLGASISWAVAEALGPVVFGGYHADEQQ